VQRELKLPLGASFPFVAASDIAEASNEEEVNDIFSSPPQADEGRAPHQLATGKIKVSRSQSFSKSILNLIMRTNVHEINILAMKLLTYKMEIHLNVLGPGMENRIGGKNKFYITTPHN
jgi:hypothetical protein